MSDIYDYAYVHVMQKHADVYYSTTYEESNSENEVNTADFSPRDLQMFVDSLETIARLEQAKLGQRQKRKVKKQQAPVKKRQVTCLDSSSCSSIHDEDLNSFSDMSSSSEYLYDETYFGRPIQGQSTALYSNLNAETNVTTTSDSEESGIFVSNDTTASHLYENIQPLRPRSKIVSYSKGKSLKSRLLALIMKKQYVKTALPSKEILSSTTIGEQSEEHDIYDRVVDDVIQQQLDKKLRKPKKKTSDSKPENKFLDKAMRLLTL